jgi:hypothetical protein
MSNDLRGERNERCANVSNHRGTGFLVDAPPPVEVHADYAALFLECDLCLPPHLLVLVARVIPDKHDVGTRHVNPLSALLFNVVLVLRPEVALELAIAKIEVDVLVRLPCQHQPVLVEVGAAESNKSAGKSHTLETANQAQAQPPAARSRLQPRRCVFWQLPKREARRLLLAASC